MMNSLVVPALLLAGALAAPGATQGDAAAPVSNSTLVPVLLGMKQNNIDKMMDYVMEVSDPTSPKHGQHYTRDQIAALFTPSDTAIASVNTWLVGAGVPADAIAVSTDKTWVRFASTAGHIDSLFSANLTQPGHGNGRGLTTTTTKKRGVAAGGPAVLKVPPHLAAVLDSAVSSLNTSHSGDAVCSGQGRVRTRPFKGLVSPTSLNNCDELVTPACIRAMYRVPASAAANETKPQAPQGNNILGIFETPGSSYN
ncbi:hypothetical protein QQS21_006461 [Conoideocrella luteorostrata]|uniref:Peptidase S53 activation domain-containing protein n=1 Tax=Conoideocrella luteorostrata TaxID=1105319 RepID=A0AAJ0CMJ0_9HYPO|nr:hypothetical protein QQS21_006461 [Conoideocrella luteorostrata]